MIFKMKTKVTNGYTLESMEVFPLEHIKILENRNRLNTIYMRCWISNVFYLFNIIDWLVK